MYYPAKIIYSTLDPNTDLRSGWKAKTSTTKQKQNISMNLLVC